MPDLRRFSDAVDALGRRLDALVSRRNDSSWIIVSRETGEPVMETFKLATARAINRDRYEVLTAEQWLHRFNAAVKKAGGVQPKMQGRPRKDDIEPMTSHEREAAFR